MFEQERALLVRAAEGFGCKEPRLDLLAGPLGYEVVFTWVEGTETCSLASGWLSHGDIRANRLDAFRNHLKHFATRIRARKLRGTSAGPPGWSLH